MVGFGETHNFVNDNKINESNRLIENHAYETVMSSDLIVYIYIYMLWRTITMINGCMNKTRDLVAYILHTSKITCSKHVKQYWCETSEDFLRKWPMTWILTYFGAQNGPEIWPLRPTLYARYSKIDVNPKENFNKILKNLNFDSFGGPKWPQNLGLLHTYRSSSN